MEQAAAPEAIEEDLPKEDQQAAQHCLRGRAKIMLAGTVFAIIFIFIAVIAARFGRIIPAIVAIVMVIAMVAVVIMGVVSAMRSGRQSTDGAIH